MRIAVCFSGQLRTWRKCYESWHNLFSRFDIEVDYFYHFWNFNTLANILNDTTPNIISQDELDEIYDILKPKKFIIEDHDKNLKVINDLKIMGENYPLSGGTPVYWSGGQFYSHMRSVHLKRQYEIEHNFNYDICFRMRADLFFNQSSIDDFIREFKNPKSNTIYSSHNGQLKYFPYFKIGDMFYYSDSITFDKISEFYRFLPVIGKTPFKNEDYPPEVPFCFFIKMLKIDNFITFADPKIMRSEEYLLRKGELGNHELI